MFREEHKGWEIEYNENKEVFEATKDEYELEDKSLKNLKKRIVKYKFTREKVYFNLYQKLMCGEVTTKFDDGRYRVAYTAGGMGETKYNTWTKTSRGYLFKFNESNKKIFEQVQKRREQMEKLQEEINNLKKDLMPFIDLIDSKKE